MSRTLVVTNDFPPRAGGIQSFLHELLVRLPPEEVVVYAPAWPGAAAFDAAAKFPVVRHPGRLMLPGPPVARRALELMHTYRCDRVLFGAAAPLALLAPVLREGGARRAVGITHGHEASWAAVPGGRAALRRIGAGLDVLTYLGDYTGRRIAGALAPADRPKLVRLRPGVDTAAFRPRAGGDQLRRELGLGDRPLVVCVSRLVPRKGQDVLIRALPAVRREVPDAALLLIGDGPDRERLERLARGSGLAPHVVGAGAVPAHRLRAGYDAGNVFAMPCRTRRGGLDVEGLGMVFLEASAAGLPVVAGDSGGAPDAVRPAETGFVVDGRSVAEVAARLTELLADPHRARRMGECGRRWVLRDWSWERQAALLAELLGLD